MEITKMANLRLIRVDYDQAPDLEKFYDHTIFQTIQWLQFVSLTQNAEPVIAIIKDGDRTVGRFTGLIVKKYPWRILGSLLPGWTTSYMGFNLEPSISRIDALRALEEFALRDLKCVHLEIMDRRFDLKELKIAKYKYKILSGFEIDLKKSEEKLFMDMTPACRRCIRKAEKSGVQIEIVKDLSFVDDYYAQLQDVFAKQKLVPTYGKERVQTLIECLLPTERLLLVRAINSEGTAIATGIFPALNDTMYFWGGASWRSYQILRPNEALQWFAMCYWKQRGIVKYDMMGSGEYKRKYGCYEIAVPWVRKSKYEIFEQLRNGAKSIFAFKQRLLGLNRY
jgi:GNAT acetyltransferase-like protein